MVEMFRIVNFEVGKHFIEYIQKWYKVIYSLTKGKPFSNSASSSLSS